MFCNSLIKKKYIYIYIYTHTTGSATIECISNIRSRQDTVLSEKQI